MGFFLTNPPPAARKKAAGPRRGGGGVGPGGGGAVTRSSRKSIEIKPSLRECGAKQGGCYVCPLYAQRGMLAHPKMEPTGSGSPVIYILGEAPGANEDERGEQFIGRSGQLIREQIPEELEPHVRWNNTVRCRPEGNRTPIREEIVACSQYQVEDIERTTPLVVMGFGAVPLHWALDTEDGIGDWRGRLVPARFGTHECWYAPMLHPAYVLRAGNDKKRGGSIRTTFDRDMQRVFDKVLSGELSPPYIPTREELDAGLEIELSWDLKEVARKLAELSALGPLQAVDVETNGLRPYAKDSRILSISVGTWDRAYAIPLQHREAKWTAGQLRKLWGMVREYMKQPHLTFYAHMLKFEQEWLGMPWALGREALYEIRWGDTAAGAEVLRTQSLSAKSLDSCAVAVLGVRGKMDEVNRAFLETTPLPRVLTYNARDVKLTHRIAEWTEVEVEREGLQQAYELMVSRTLPLAIAQQEGVMPNTAFALRKHEELTAAVEKIERRIQAFPEVQQLTRETGAEFNSGSNVQLTVLFRDRLHVKEGWRVVGGKRKYSTDEEVLKKVKHPIAGLILEKRSLTKLNSTYVLGLCDPAQCNEKGAGKLLHEDGLVHTNFNYLVARTGRLSSDDPNLQNFPKRENKEVRSVIRAPDGMVMVSIDYGQIEARVIAMAAECPVLCAALWDHYDIHLAWTERLAEAFPYVMDRYMKKVGKDEKKAIKAFRNDIKNVWTFPQFFGSALPPIAEGLGIPLRDLEPHSKKFWDMFGAVKKWQQRTLAHYNRHGYTETLTGRRRHEPLTTNEIINTPIQGTASDIVVDAMGRLACMSVALKRPQLAPRINVHDDLTFYLHEGERMEEDLPLIVKTMCTPPFDFISVPITVEVGVGKDWGTVEDAFSVESTEFDFPQRPAFLKKGNGGSKKGASR